MTVRRGSVASIQSKIAANIVIDRLTETFNALKDPNEVILEFVEALARRGDIGFPQTLPDIRRFELDVSEKIAVGPKRIKGANASCA
ncbi:MAG: hypothetical protein WDN46_14180 [Methylocella sp.]